MNDLVIIPLRVSREQRRVWRGEAAAEDKSLQRWILGKLGVGWAVEKVREAREVEEPVKEPVKVGVVERVEVTKGKPFMGAYE